MALMRVTSGPSMTMYLTRPFTYPPPAPPNDDAEALAAADSSTNVTSVASLHGGRRAGVQSWQRGTGPSTISSWSPTHRRWAARLRWDQPSTNHGAALADIPSGAHLRLAGVMVRWEARVHGALGGATELTEAPYYITVKRSSLGQNWSSILNGTAVSNKPIVLASHIFRQRRSLILFFLVRNLTRYLT